MKKRKIVSGIVIVVILMNAINIIGGNIQLRPRSTESPDTLANYLIPLQTTEAGNGFEDLEALKVVLEDKKVVAMGEATHGTKEFFEMKHRMFEFLVEEMGFRVFAIEAEFGGVQAVNDYILHGEGNLLDTLRYLHFYQTEEVADLIEWMRNYNENPNNSSKIKFYGFDMQNDHLSKTHIMEYLEEVDQENYSEYSANYNSLTIEDLELILDNNNQLFINQTSEVEYNMIYQHLNIMKQNKAFRDTRKRLDSFNLRDYYMAENIQWILDYEKQFGNDKIMLWAHNGHVGREYAFLTPMGKHLYEAYGDELYIIGFDFYQGTLRALPKNISGGVIQRVAEFNVKPHKGLFATSFYKTGVPLGFMDFKSVSEDKALANWLSEIHYLRNVGATYTPYVHQVVSLVPMKTYDGIIFINKTSAAIGTKGAKTDTLDGHTILRNYYLVRFGILLFLFLLWLWLTERLHIIWKRGLKLFKNNS